MITSGIYIFISQATSDANTHFDIKTLTPHNNDRFVIQYIFPLERNFQAIGLDIGSEADRRGAALDAARTNQPRLTAPITLVQEGDKPRRGVLILLPIYPSGANLLSPEEREEKVLGWAYAPLVIDDVLAKLDGIMNQSEITLSNLSESEPFYSSPARSEIASAEHHITRDIYVLGQHWRLDLKPYQSTINNASHWNISLAIAIGIILTALVLIVLAIIRNSSIPQKLITLMI